MAITFNDVRIIYPDYLGTGTYNTYKRNLFHIIVPPEEVPLMESSGIRVRTTKPTQAYPDQEPYVEIAMGYRFLSQDGQEVFSDKPPIITLTNIADGSVIEITYDNLEILATSRLSNINIVVNQSTPKINNMTGQLRSRFYLRSMTADITPFYVQGQS